MVNRWSDIDFRDYISRYGHQADDDDLLLQAYATTLLGAEDDLTMHGGGNTSVKKNITDNAANTKRALYVKASGVPLSAFTTEHFVAMDFNFLEEVKLRKYIDNETMSREFRDHRLFPSDGRLPSIESLMHASVPAKFVDHMHPAAILKIVNRIGGSELLLECFGYELAVIPYARPGFDLARAFSEVILQSRGCMGVVMRHHGLIVWGNDAREVYDYTIDIITRAENFLASKFIRPITPEIEVSADTSMRNYELTVPIIKKCLLQKSQEAALTLLNTSDILKLINSREGKSIITNPPLTPDYPMPIRILPQWLDIDMEDIYTSVNESIDASVPCALIHPKIGVVCIGKDINTARMLADFIRQSFAIRREIFETGGAYECLAEEHLHDLQYREYRQENR